MNLLELERTTLEEALNTELAGVDGVSLCRGVKASTYNSILLMARSGITGYFSKMDGEFRALARALGMAPQRLATMSFGEVACSVSRKFGRGASGEGGLFKPESLTEERCALIDAFLRPLVHTVQTGFHQEECIPLSQQKPLEYTVPLSAKAAFEEPICLDPTPDYFSDHLVALPHSGLEQRVVSFFSFEINHYCEAVGSITGEGERLARLLAPYDPSIIPALRRSLLSVVGWLEQDRQTIAPWSHGFDPLHAEAMSAPSTSTLVSWAGTYEILYLLLIHPFACLYEQSAA